MAKIYKCNEKELELAKKLDKVDKEISKVRRFFHDNFEERNFHIPKKTSHLSIIKRVFPVSRIRGRGHQTLYSHNQDLPIKLAQTVHIYLK
jgi:hypothetical protein